MEDYSLEKIRWWCEKEYLLHCITSYILSLAHRVSSLGGQFWNRFKSVSSVFRCYWLISTVSRSLKLTFANAGIIGLQWLMIQFQYVPILHILPTLIPLIHISLTGRFSSSSLYCHVHSSSIIRDNIIIINHHCHKHHHHHHRHDICVTKFQHGQSKQYDRVFSHFSFLFQLYK